MKQEFVIPPDTPTTTEFVETARYSRVVVDASGHIVYAEEYANPSVLSKEVETPIYKTVITDERNRVVSGTTHQLKKTLDDCTLLRERLLMRQAERQLAVECTRRECLTESSSIENGSSYAQLFTDSNGVIHEAIHGDGIHEFPFGVLVPTLLIRHGEDIYALVIEGEDDNAHLVLRKQTQS